MQQLKLSWETIKKDIMKEQMIYSEECNRLGKPCYIFSCSITFQILVYIISNHFGSTFSGVNLKPLVHASENYRTILAENRKLFNELQELKGNIIFFCIMINLGMSHY